MKMLEIKQKTEISFNVFNDLFGIIERMFNKHLVVTDAFSDVNTSS